MPFFRVPFLRREKILLVFLVINMILLVGFVARAIYCDQQATLWRERWEQQTAQFQHHVHCMESRDCKSMSVMPHRLTDTGDR